MQIPFGILSDKYGSLRFLGWGMMINSVFALLVPLAANNGGVIALCVVRLIQGLGEGPIVPCTHSLLAKWVTPGERSRSGAIIYAGAQFGTIISMPISALLCDHAGGWPSVFYVFGGVGVLWSAVFLKFTYEDPATDPHITETERKHIIDSIGVNRSGNVLFVNVLRNS